MRHVALVVFLTVVYTSGKVRKDGWARLGDSAKPKLRCVTEQLIPLRQPIPIWIVFRPARQVNLPSVQQFERLKHLDRRAALEGDPKRARDSRDRCRSGRRRRLHDGSSTCGNPLGTTGCPNCSLASGMMCAASSSRFSRQSGKRTATPIGADHRLAERRLVKPLLDSAKRITALLDVLGSH